MKPLRLAGLILALACAGPARADTLVDNVDGFTLDEKGIVERLTGLVIGNDGRILQILHSGDRRPARPDFLIDGKGRVLMPGFIDSQVRLIPLGLAEMTLDLSGVRSLAEAQTRIAAWAAAHPDRPWIIGHGWDAQAWGLNRAPTAADLDAAAPGSPVWLESRDGHTGWASSAAIKLAGIAPATRDPAGGRITRAAPGGSPTGLLMETAMDLVRKVLPQPRPAEIDMALAAAQERLLSRGTIAVADMGTSIEHWQAYRRAGDSGALRLRIMAYADGIESMTLIGGSAPGPWLYDDHLHLNGLSLMLDGGLDTRGALLKLPYADAPTSRGMARLSPSQLRNLMSRAAMDGFQVSISASGDAAVATTLDAIEELAPTYKGERHWRIDGVSAIDPVDAARAGRLGMYVSAQAGGLADERESNGARLGEARQAMIQPWRNLLSAGARLSFASGAPAGAINPFAAWASAITRQGADGLPFGGWQAQERLSPEAALVAMTISGANAGMAETRFGRLAPGQRADFLFVDRDPFLSGPADLHAMKVQETWIGGIRAWAAPDSAPGSSEGPQGR